MKAIEQAEKDAKKGDGSQKNKIDKAAEIDAAFGHFSTACVENPGKYHLKDDTDSKMICLYRVCHGIL